MVIEELYLKHFGKFTETRFELSDKIHVFYGENEYGKSTIYAFIKAMLFGLERGRGRASKNDEFSRYEPWDNANYYAGVMRFSCGGRMFRLERAFDRYGKKATLICEDDGEELSIEDGDLNMLLDGMTAVSFENVAAIGQLTARPGQELSAELKNCAANYYETGSGAVDFHGAVELLNERKKNADKTLRRLREEQNQKGEKLRIQEEYVNTELKKLDDQQQEFEQKLGQVSGQIRNEQSHIQRVDRSIQQTHKKNEKRPEDGIANMWRRIGKMLLIVFLVGAVIGTGVSLVAHIPLIMFWVCWIVFFIGSGLSLGFFINLSKGKVKRRQNQMQDESESYSGKEDALEIEQRRQVLEALKQQEQKIRWSMEQIEQTRQEKQVQLNNLREQIEEVQVPGEEYRKVQQRGQALALAIERLGEAAAAMTQDFGARLNRETSQILFEITNGAYEKVFVDENLNLSVLSEGRRIPVERLSRGTTEQLYFAFRMAALNLLYPEEDIPVVFDDAFVHYDEKRLKSTLKWLSEQSRQVIIFSCQKREQKMVEGL